MSPLNRLYYLLKPYLPVAVRYQLRRFRALIKLRREKHWPILESAGRAPEGWRGWPAGKRFAVVLTHDVEGPVGLARCSQLARLEEQLGFRSSFNFIPEGDYAVTAAARAELAGAGFEIGVHDLKHDGSLFRSHREFRTAAVAINRYLGEWGAAGFRAGFMFHNLDWIKELAVEYDASTFDIDPFEAQPDGMGTIFPFWVARQGPWQGYVELPYTLPQDSTLFLILRHRSAALWKRKVDWIAQQGGMVLLNVHPDYLAFDAAAPAVSEFPAAIYADLLRYLAERYRGEYWHALPREVAREFRRGRAESGQGSQI